MCFHCLGVEKNCDDACSDILSDSMNCRYLACDNDSDSECCDMVYGDCTQCFASELSAISCVAEHCGNGFISKFFDNIFFTFFDNFFDSIFF